MRVIINLVIAGACMFYLSEYDSIASVNGIDRLDHFSENNIDGGILCLRRANMFLICNYMS